MSASYETTLKDIILAKAKILERMTKITGYSGLEEKLKDVVKSTALAAQRSLIPYLEELDEDKKEKALSLFEAELLSILQSIDSGLETTPPPKTR